MYGGCYLYSQVSVEEAKKTVDLWYNERQEVLTWQEARKKESRIDNHVHTLLGRARRFPAIKSLTRSQRNHIERAAINTPVQVFSFPSCTSKFYSLFFLTQTWAIVTG